MTGEATSEPSVGACLARDHEQGHHALRKGRVSIPNGIYLVTTTTLERERMFDNFAVGCAAARCFENKALLGEVSMLAWVLMPDHAHWLLQLGKRNNLSSVVNRLKSASARHANLARKRSGGGSGQGHFTTMAYAVMKICKQ